MKTKNNVQKAILSTVVILTGIAILNVSTNAQGFWSNVDDRNDNTLAMKTHSSSDLKSKVNNEAAPAASYMELTIIEKEAPLTVENWMLDDFIKENENPVSKNKDGLSAKKGNPDVETVEVKKQTKIYSTKTFVYKELEDPELNFEAWMFDSSHWKVK